MHACEPLLNECVYVCNDCGGQKCGSAGVFLTGGCELPDMDGCQEQNSSPLQEQYTTFNAEHSLQASWFYFKIFSF